MKTTQEPSWATKWVNDFLCERGIIRQSLIDFSLWLLSKAEKCKNRCLVQRLRDLADEYDSL